MLRRNYDKLIQTRVDRSFNRILEITSLIAFIASIILFSADLSKVYFLLNFSAGTILLAFSIFASRIRTSIKIIILVVITAIISVASFLGGSFTSAFLTIIIISNIVAVIFLQQKASIIISISSLSLMIVLGSYSLVTALSVERGEIRMTWGLQLAAFILLLLVLHISVYSLKKFLIENIESLDLAVSQANQLAYYDQLTKLPNAYKFKIEVDEQMSKHHKNGFILILNFKNFYLINSTLGQKIVDRFILDIKISLEKVKHEDMLIAKIDSNEIAVWTDNLKEEDLQQWIAVFILELNTRNSIFKKKQGFYASYAKFTYGVNSLDQCYQKALVTLAYAKSKDSIKLVAYTDQLEEELRRKEMLKNLMEQAISNQEFTLFYQAKYDSRTKEVVGVEGLARWNSKELGVVSPLEFIPIMEMMNLSVEFGDFVINKACQDFAKLQEKYHQGICVSINISPSHITDPIIIDTMREAISKYEIPPRQLVLEITEDIIIGDIDELKPILCKLRELKILISLDDFGSGYSALNYLPQLDIDELKFDKTLIDQIETNAKVRILLENLLKVSEQFNLNVIAEGVENKRQCDELSRLGCYIIQGFYFAKPEKL